MGRQRRSVPPLVLAALILLTACGGSTPKQAVRTDRVELPKSYRFEPPTIEVDVGTSE